MTGILAMKPCLDKFGTGTTGSGVSLVFSMYSVGSLIGSFPAAFVADRFGRKPSMWLGAVFIIVGMIIASAAQDFSTLIGGRFVLGCE
jgi:predicted MFS family arabinose efflux permease